MALEAVMAKTGANPVSQVLEHLGDFYEWRDYPDGGVRDLTSGYGYFYHAHPGGAFEGEHGHFHLFWSDADGKRSNLVALSMDGFGRLTGAFAPNLWHCALTPDEDLLARYSRFRVELVYPCWAANQWLGAAVRGLAAPLTRLHRRALTLLDEPGVTEDRGRPVIVAERIDLSTAAVPVSRPSLKTVKR
jgi:hypothetical protein